MSVVIFTVGVLVFLITVYGSVVVGGLLLTDRQFDEQPEIAPDESRPKKADSRFDRARALARSKF